MIGYFFLFLFVGLTIILICLLETDKEEEEEDPLFPDITDMYYYKKIFGEERESE